MGLTPFTHYNTTGQPGGSTLLDRIVDNLVKTFDSLLNVVLNDAQVTMTITTSDTLVYHGLGSIPKSWDIVDRNANATVWRTAPMTAQTVTLKASATVTVTIRFN